VGGLVNFACRRPATRRGRRTPAGSCQRTQGSRRPSRKRIYDRDGRVGPPDPRATRTNPRRERFRPAVSIRRTARHRHLCATQRTPDGVAPTGIIGRLGHVASPVTGQLRVASTGVQGHPLGPAAHVVTVQARRGHRFATRSWGAPSPRRRGGRPPLTLAQPGRRLGPRAQPGPRARRCRSRPTHCRAEGDVGPEARQTDDVSHGR